jgi:predicted N-acetyltransferase YhbS
VTLEMARIDVHDMTPEDEYFVSTCSHVNESEEADACGQRRLAWLKKMQPEGLRVKVATLDGRQAGFLYAMPIEISPWGPLGKDLLAIPCLWVPNDKTKSGIGEALVAAAEEEATWQELKGMLTIGYYHDFWFMPASYFEKIGFSVAERRDDAAALWKVHDQTAQKPCLLERKYRFRAVRGKTVVDLFWNSFCGTSNKEAQRVREVAAEFGSAVILNEYCADDRETLLRYQTPRGVFVDGREIYWGYEAPKDGIREAISKALHHPK